MLDSEDLRGGGTVNVFPGFEGADQTFVPGQVRHDAKLNLGIVRGQELIARFGNESLSDLPTGFGSNGNILQVRLGG